MSLGLARLGVTRVFALFDRRAKGAKMRVRQVTQEDVAEINFVALLMAGSQSQNLTLKGLSDEAPVVEPLDISLGIDRSQLKFGTVFQRSDRMIFQQRRHIDLSRSPEVQSFVRPDFIEVFDPLLGAPLLGRQGGGRWIGYL